MPVAAERVGWRWQLAAHVAAKRTDGPAFAGRRLADFGDQPVLIFGSAEARAQMRPLMQEARRFILAVKDAARGGARAPVEDGAAQ